MPPKAGSPQPENLGAAPPSRIGGGAKFALRCAKTITITPASRPLAPTRSHPFWNEETRFPVRSPLPAKPPKRDEPEGPHVTKVPDSTCACPLAGEVGKHSFTTFILLKNLALKAVPRTGPMKQAGPSPRGTSLMTGKERFSRSPAWRPVEAGPTGGGDCARSCGRRGRGSRRGRGRGAPMRSASCRGREEAGPSLRRRSP